MGIAKSTAAAGLLHSNSLGGANAGGSAGKGAELSSDLLEATAEMLAKGKDGDCFCPYQHAIS